MSPMPTARFSVSHTSVAHEIYLKCTSSRPETYVHALEENQTPRVTPVDVAGLQRKEVRMWWIGLRGRGRVGGWPWDEESRKQENCCDRKRACFLVNSVWKRVGCCSQQCRPSWEKGAAFTLLPEDPRRAWPAICLTCIRGSFAFSREAGTEAQATPPLPPPPALCLSDSWTFLQIHRDLAFSRSGERRGLFCQHLLSH